jgi:hypothetical protein
MPKIYLEPQIYWNDLVGDGLEKIEAMLSVNPINKSDPEMKLVARFLRIINKTLNDEKPMFIKMPEDRVYHNPNNPKPYLFGLRRDQLENIVSEIFNNLLNENLITHETHEKLESKKNFILKGLPDIYLAKNNSLTKFRPQSNEVLPDAFFIITVKTGRQNELSDFVMQFWLNEVGLMGISHIVKGVDPGPFMYLYLLKTSHIPHLRALIENLKEVGFITEDQLNSLKQQIDEIFNDVFISNVTSLLNSILGQKFKESFEKLGGNWTLQKQNDNGYLILEGLRLLKLEDLNWYKSKLGRHGIKEVDFEEIKDNKRGYYLRIHDVQNVVTCLDKNERAPQFSSSLSNSLT